MPYSLDSGFLWSLRLSDPTPATRPRSSSSRQIHQMFPHPIFVNVNHFKKKSNQPFSRSMELFLNKELRAFVNDPWNSIPIFREKDAKETIALVVQSLVQLEAKKVSLSCQMFCSFYDIAAVYCSCLFYNTAVYFMIFRLFYYFMILKITTWMLYYYSLDPIVWYFFPD